METIILASASPRRSELLKAIGLPFQVVPSLVEEVEAGGRPGPEVALARAAQKAAKVAAQYPERLVLGCDTVVSLDGMIMDKPADEREAAEMLRTLSGRTHLVSTGLVLQHLTGGRTLRQVVTTRVTFRTLSDEEIRGYLATGEPYDKAGGYGIQGKGSLLVERIEGCYFNVVGLPLARLGEMLKSFGVDPLCPSLNTMSK